MKVLVNGGLNLSELDGWWAEAYSPEVGWAIGDGQEHGDDPSWDAKEAETLYTVLEDEVIPEFYERDESGMPSKWLGRIRESMARLTPEFSATRTIREYTESHYLPAASGYRDRAADDGALRLESAPLEAGPRSALEHGAFWRCGNRDTRRPAFLSGSRFIRAPLRAINYKSSSMQTQCTEVCLQLKQ